MTERYSAVDWPVSELLADIRREARVPDAELTDAEILTEATDAIWTEISEILTVDQAVSGWGLYFEDTSVGSVLGASDDEFALPANATAEGFLSVEWFRSSTDTNPYRLSPIGRQVQDDWNYQYSSATGDPQFYTLEAGRIRLLPRPSAGTGKVRVWYQARHPELVATTNNATTLVSHTPSMSLTLAGTPSNWPTPTSSVPIRLDLYSGYGPHRYVYRGLTVTDITANVASYSFSDEDETAIAEAAANASVNVALHGQADVVMLPIEFRKPLRQKVAGYILRQIGDEAGANSMEGMSERSLARARNIFVPRTKGQAQRWINRRSALRSGARRNRWR